MAAERRFSFCVGVFFWSTTDRENSPLLEETRGSVVVYFQYHGGCITVVMTFESKYNVPFVDSLTKQNDKVSPASP